MSNITEYWIGENVDYSKLWDAYNSGKDGYIQKFHSMKTAPVRIEFDLPHSHDPLFNLEAIYKTLKGLYYDFKSSCITDKNERDQAGPLFVYSIERGSGDWLLYIESKYVIPFIYFLARASLDICHKYYKTKKEYYKSEKAKIEYENLKRKFDETNTTREKNNMEKIEQANIDKLTQDRSLALTNIVIAQGIKKIIIEDSKITIYFDNEDEQEKNQNKHVPPVNG